MHSKSIDLAPRLPGALHLVREPTDLPRPVQRAVAAELGRGAVMGARIEATSYVADLALDAVARLTREEEHHVDQTPHGTARFALIVDTATQVMAEDVARMRARG